MWPSLRAVPFWVVMTAALVVGGALALAWMALMALVWTYGERRIAGFIQARLGPNRVGPMGVLQPVADGIKLLVKEDIIPDVAHRTLYTMAPLLVFVGALLPFAALPFSERFVVGNMALGLYFILAFEAIEVIGILMAGWAPGSKWSLYGGMRLAAQMLSYEIPLGLCILVVVMLAGSLNLNEIVAWQSRDAFGLEHPWILGWAIFRSPAALLAFAIFYVGGLAATKRAPFDLPEAESELVAGYHTEYSGMRFAFFFMAEYASMYIVCAVAAIVFLGGWHAPIPRPAIPEGAHLATIWAAHVQAASPNTLGSLAKAWAFAGSLCGTIFSGDGLRIAAHEAIGVVNLLLKAFALYFIMIWVRWTLPRVRIDQVMYLCLKVLLPFGLACVIWAAVQTVMAG
jgi:NADH-quinone oxidoreductase subunit H